MNAHHCRARLALILSCPLFIAPSAWAGDPSDNPKDGGSAWPRIAMLWSSIRGDASLKGLARHDLALVSAETLGLKWNRQPIGLADGFTPESVQAARKKVAEIRALNPHIVLLAEVYFYEWGDGSLPEDHPWWMRKDGQRQQFWPGTHRMNWYDAGYRHHVALRSLALKAAGVNGIFYDNLREEPEPWVALLKEVRTQAGDDFLMLANVGYAVGKHDFAAPFLNGFMYESGWSHNRTGQWSEVIAAMQQSEKLLRQPRISVIERFEDTGSRAGWPGDAKRGQKPTPDPAARRWSLSFALIAGDYYYLFSDSTSHHHDWYHEYDDKIGRPKEPGRRISAYVWERNYERARVIVNLPGAREPYRVELPNDRTDTLTGEKSRSFTIAPGDGRILRDE